MLTTDDISMPLQDRLMSLPKDVLLEVMLQAIDEMQAYNGRSHNECILLAIEAENIDDTKWRIPGRSKIIKIYRP
jgi:hypothetical protein